MKNGERGKHENSLCECWNGPNQNTRSNCVLNWCAPRTDSLINICLVLLCQQGAPSETCNTNAPDRVKSKTKWRHLHFEFVARTRRPFLKQNLPPLQVNLSLETISGRRRTVKMKTIKNRLKLWDWSKYKPLEDRSRNAAEEYSK